ncbi:MAG: tetratricopeptide repeat protein [Spirochaetales bacterium]|nr:tetratricopeptide repeat protein [Spirochaetales bacterium]
MFSLSSCSVIFREPLLDVVDGNAKFATGNYNEATISYLKARKITQNHPLIDYNIGNVYYALGETSASIAELQSASSSHDTELRYRGHFNLGIINFEQNRFLEAISHFIDALRIKPKDIDAKVNLELAIRELDKHNSLDHDESEQRGVVPLTADEKKIFDKILKKEERIWKSLLPGSASQDKEDW